MIANAHRRGWGYRANVGARAAAAVLGGYALAALTAFAAARAWPADRLQASVAATMLAFLIVPPAAVFAFLAANPWRAWGGILVSCALLWLAGLALGPHG